MRHLSKLHRLLLKQRINGYWKQCFYRLLPKTSMETNDWKNMEIIRIFNISSFLHFLPKTTIGAFSKGALARPQPGSRPLTLVWSIFILFFKAFCKFLKWQQDGCFANPKESLFSQFWQVSWKVAFEIFSDAATSSQTSISPIDT